MDKLKALIEKYREQIAYLFFGALTTLVNIVVYYIVNDIMGMATVPATALAQVFAVIFAYITNKLFVFKSQTHGAAQLLREMGSFFACRAISFFLDIGIMWIAVDLLCWPNMLMKIISNVIIVLVNYVASKMLIFNKGKGEDK